MKNSNLKHKVHKSCTHRLFSPTQLDLIEKLHIPTVVRFTLAGSFETKFINSTAKVWIFNYSGKREYIDFNKDNFLDDYEIRLLKFFLVYYSQVNSPAYMSRYFNLILSVFKELVKNKKTLKYMNLEDIIINFAQNKNKHVEYYILKKFVLLLLSEELQYFSDEDELKLEVLDRPSSFNSELFYQETEDLIDKATITLIQNGFAQLNAQIIQGKVADSKIKNASILGLVYVTGMRPVQLSKLAVEDIKVDTYSNKGECMRYSILVPYAKQGRYSHSRISIKLPEEIATIVIQYIKQFNLASKQQLFDLGNHAVAYCTKAINKQLFAFSPKDYKKKVIDGELIQIKYTTNQFRHHVAYSMAMSGASAEDIAYILGHSSLVTARHYIYSSPNLAQVRAMALGRNPVYRQMIAMLMTGDIITREDNTGKNIIGLVGDSLHNDIGKCAYVDVCFLEPVRSCYGCVYFHPHIDGSHKEVLSSVQKELESIVSISNATHTSSNPIIHIHEATKFEIESVIKRCELNNEVKYATR